MAEDRKKKMERHRDQLFTIPRRGCRGSDI